MKRKKKTSIKFKWIMSSLAEMKWIRVMTPKRRWQLKDIVKRELDSVFYFSFIESKADFRPLFNGNVVYNLCFYMRHEYVRVYRFKIALQLNGLLGRVRKHLNHSKIICIKCIKSTTITCVEMVYDWISCNYDVAVVVACNIFKLIN